MTSTPRGLCRLFVTMMLTTLPLGACSSTQLGAYGPLDAQAPGGALISVENRFDRGMRVYLDREGTLFPLGSIETLERRTFPVPTSLLGHLGVVVLRAEALGGHEAYSSHPIPAGPGDHVEWTITPYPQHSTFRVTRISTGGRRRPI